MRAIVLGCPDVGPCDLGHRRRPAITTVVSQLGRPDDGTDVSGFYNIELFAPLAPASTWPRGLTKDKMTAELARELREDFPGVIFNFSQMISDNVEEAMSGVKGENSVKVFGPSVVDNERTAEKVTEILGSVKGIEDLGISRSSGQPSIRIVPDRQLCSRYGLNTGNVETIIQAAIGGKAVTKVFEGDRTFDLTVRWLAPYRDSVEAINELMIFTPDGTALPLGQLAKVSMEDSPVVVFREDGTRYSPVKFSVRGRDLQSTVAEAQQKVQQMVTLGPSMHMEWSGELNELREAQNRLKIIIPATLLLIALLVYTSVKTIRATLVVLMNIPVACAGGILALFLSRLNFSVSAAMGFISVFGIAIQDALLVVSYFHSLREQGKPLEEAAYEAGETRLRPVLMTTLVAIMGLLPAALSHGIGSETQKPLAVVVIGGAVVLAIVARLVQSPMLILVHRLRAPWESKLPAAELAPHSLPPPHSHGAE
jgi:cobalt-zinc-cadmium resistance protein CzcA